MWRQSKRDKIELVQTCVEEIWRVYWEKDGEDGSLRQEEKRKAKEELYGRGKRRRIQVVGVTEEDAEERMRWKQMICCHDH